MATIRLIPSTYSTGSTNVSVSNANNMYANTDSTNYATATTSRSGNTYVYIKGFNFTDVPIFSGGTFDNGIYHIGTVDEDGYCHIDEGTANEALFDGIHVDQHSLSLSVFGRRSFDIYGRTFDTIEEIQQNFIDARDEIDNVIRCVNENCFYLFNGDYEEQFSTERINSLFNDGKNHDILERLIIKLPYNLMVSLFSSFDVYQKYIETP